VFTDNNNFVANFTLKQKKVYTAQTHAAYNFKPGLWASISTGYGIGGQKIEIDQEKLDFEVDNWVWAEGGKASMLVLTCLKGLVAVPENGLNLARR
jgi:hypothetical protein